MECRNYSLEFIRLNNIEKEELFVCNTDPDTGIPKKWKSLKPVRLGKQAYTIDGHKLSPDYCVPVIVHKSEYMELNRLWGEEFEENAKRLDKKYGI